MDLMNRKPSLFAEIDKKVNAETAWEVFDRPLLADQVKSFAENIAVTEVVSKLYEGSGLEELQNRLKELREFPEIQAIEKQAGITLQVVVNAAQVTQFIPPNMISINPDIFNTEFATTLPPGFEENLSEATDIEFFAALDNYPDYYRFSVDRVIIHEAYHATQNNTGLSYALNPDSYERAVIDTTNIFMRNHFGEPFRLNHTDARRMQ